MADMQGGIFFMTISDRRISPRLSLRFGMSYRRQGHSQTESSDAAVRNVSTGGICFQTMDETLCAGTMIEISLRVPPRHGVLEDGGCIMGRARVLWSARPQSESNHEGHVVGAQFHDRPALETGAGGRDEPSAL
jgi:hypothetical protein